ncbi:HAMP domain-containing protein [bacterium]|nr:MAG: HAMP domain-containing protein [bacterium]
MTLRGKLLAAQMPLGIALAIISLVSTFSLVRLGEKSERILSENYRSVLAAQRMDESLERLDDVAVKIVFGAPLSEVDEPSSKLIKDFEDELTAAESNITEPGERETLARLWTDWLEAAGRFEVLGKTPPSAQSRVYYDSEVSPAVARVKAGITNLLDLNQDAMVRKSDRAAELSKNLQKFVLACWILSVASALTLVWHMTRRFLRPFQILQQAVRNVGEGDLEVRTSLKGQDEVAVLARDFDAMAERLSQYRKSSLGELLRAQQAAQAAIDSLPEPVLIFGTDGELMSCNLAADSLGGKEFDLKKADKQFLAAIDMLKKHVTGGKGVYSPKGLDETIRVASHSGDRYFLPSASPLRDEEGATIGFTVVLQDVTRFKRFDELKDDMVSTVAHEFRTPLTSLRMAIHICLEQIAGPLTEKQADMLTAAREECERLQTLVDDLLDLSRLQKGITPTSPEPVPAASLMTRAIARHREDAKAGEIGLRAEAGDDVTVLADPDRIATVLDNLIANALRYSPRGGSVSVRAFAWEGKVKFEVEDNGPGIPPEHQNRIFDKLYQVPGIEGGASGLGLSIVREIVLAHGGEVGVRSEPGFGSVFWFTLNSANPAASA